MKLASLSTRLLPLALACGLAPLASAQTTTATVTAPTVITSVPYTITTPGKYILPYSLSYTVGDVPAITINASNVNLDLNGFYVSGSGNTGSITPVISVGDVAGVTVKNGTLANEGQGLQFNGQTDPRDYVVENVTFTRIYEYTLFFVQPAIAGKVYACKFSNNGGTTQGTNPTAIFTNGGVRVEKCTLDTIAASTEGFTGFALSAKENFGADFAIGNTIANCGQGIEQFTFLNNLTTNVTTPFLNGNNATGNFSAQPVEP